MPASTLRRTFLLVAVVAAALAVPAVLDDSDGPPAPVGDDGVVPVVLVHGYGGDAASMAEMRSRLERAGREVLAIDLPLGGTAEIEVSAEAIAEAVAGTSVAEVDIVGFSAGGVVARAYADDAGDVRVRTVVMLGAPNHGADVAARAAADAPCQGSCAQLVPGSTFLDELNEPDETPPGPAFVSIWTAFDDVVTPPESAVLEGAVNVRLQDVCMGSGAGHVDMLSDPLALGLVVRALEGELAAPPQPSDCRELRRLGRA